jgi:cytochrome c553
MVGKREQGSDDWQIDEDDFGGLLVQHHHNDGSAVAYLWTDADGGLVARCSLCHGQRLVAEANSLPRPLAPNPAEKVSPR